MRVTANTFPNSLSQHLTNLNIRQTRLNTQAATGQRIQNPEDDPSSFHRVMDMQRDVRSLGQYQRNIQQLHDTATASYSNIKSLKKVLDRAQELTTRAGGLRSQDELNIFAEEVNQLIKSGVQIVNSRFRGDYLFSGTLTNQPPFIETNDGNGKVTAVTYQGNTEVAEAEISAGVKMGSSVPGGNSSGSGARGVVTDSRSGADLFNHLISLRDALLAGNVGSINTTISGQLGTDEDNLLIHVGINGANQAQLEAAKSLADREQLAMEGSISNEADADLSQTIVKLTQTQTAYQAALQSGGKILGQTLLDYLR